MEGESVGEVCVGCIRRGVRHIGHSNVVVLSLSLSASAVQSGSGRLWSSSAL